jgi:hypothetical protein
MQEFDQIQEPPMAALPPRNDDRPNRSPLEVYEIEEYIPTPIPKCPKPIAKPWIPLSGFLKFIWCIFVVGIGIWIGIALRFRSNLFPESPINPVRHEWIHVIFMISLAVTTFVIFFAIPLTTRRARSCALSLSIFMIYLVLAGSWMFYCHQRQPFQCENMPDKFPLYVTLQAGNPASGRLFLNNTPRYGLTHEKVNGKYHTFISAEYLYMDPNARKPINTSTPFASTGVTSIWTSLRPTEDADGTVTGTCLGRPCLDGKFWMTPNLKFEWIYKNPHTGISKRTELSSNEGEWYFGLWNRPLVSLHQNGTEVFRVQNTNTLCSAGNGDLETSLVPVGLMFIAENIYNGF